MEGYYFDPYHGGCLRVIRKRGDGTFFILGVYGSDEPSTNRPWTATASLLPQKTWMGGQRMSVDFGGKVHLTHSTLYRATWYPERGVIRWQDGNRWKKMHVSPSQGVTP